MPGMGKMKSQSSLLRKSVAEGFLRQLFVTSYQNERAALVPVTAWDSRRCSCAVDAVRCSAWLTIQNKNRSTSTSLAGIRDLTPNCGTH